MDITEVFRNGHLQPGRPKDGEFNCPNCGAPITDEKCPYCGTVFYDFTTLNLDETSYVKFKYKGKIFVCQARFISLDIDRSNAGDAYLYADNRRFIFARPPDMTMTLNFVIVPDKKGNSYLIIDEEKVMTEDSGNV